MDPEVKQAESLEVTPAEVAEVETEVASAEIADSQRTTSSNVDISSEPGTLSKLPPGQAGDQQWQEVRGQLDWLLSVLPERLGEVFEEYKQPLTTAGIVIATVPFILLTVAILRVINAIPLLSPTFELVGFGYTAWFVYRYLLFAETRQELSGDFQALKKQIVGKKDQP